MTLACFYSWAGRFESYPVKKTLRQVFSWQGSNDGGSYFQDVATDLYSNLADGFDQFIGQQSASEAIETAGYLFVFCD